MKPMSLDKVAPQAARAGTGKGDTKSFIKWLSLVVLVVQNTSLVLLIRYTRTYSEKRYLPSSVVAVSELAKLFIATSVVLFTTEGGVSVGAQSIKDQVFVRWTDTLKLVVPAGLYTIQNNLLYLAIGNLPAAVYQVVYQLKIFTTAVLSVVMLNRHLGRHQWGAMAMLVVGVSLIQVQEASKAGSATNAAGEVQNPVLGLTAVLMACCTSGFAGVYFEKLLKGHKASLWVRNIQLALFGAALGVGSSVAKDWDAIMADGFFQGYSATTWMVIALQVLGGFAVAMVVRYADNIIKGFATSVSVILSSCIAAVTMDFEITPMFTGGSVIVLCAVWVFGQKRKSDKAPNAGEGTSTSSKA